MPSINQMNPLPLPSHVHYQLLLEILERQTVIVSDQYPALRGQVQQLMFSLRKALAQQKQLEDICQQTKVPYEYRWSNEGRPLEK